MRRIFRSSTHALGESLLKGKQGPIRGITVGRFVIVWDGRPGDYMETVNTDELFGDA